MLFNLDINTILNYLNQHGIIFLFVIVFLEYLNLPGLPAGIIMPAAGILIARGSMNVWSAVIISVIAGLAGSLVLYIIGYYFGKPFLDKISSKYEKTKKPIAKLYYYLNRYGNLGVFIVRLIPVARTIISVVAGTTKLNIIPFLLYSAAGIFLWNSAFLFFGYAFGNIFFNL